MRDEVGSKQLAVGSPVQSAISDLTSHCIRCGFCLEACPTYVLTGQETESPRGRIYLARSADEGKIFWKDARVHIDRCVGCRACETACPSGVEYGKILELARDRLGAGIIKKGLLAGITKPGRFKLQLRLAKLWPGKRLPGFISRLISGEAPEADLPQAQPLSSWPPLEEEKLPPVKGKVYLLEGCAMRVLFPDVHLATRRLLRRIGYSVKESNAGCCGALHAHNGQLAEALTMAERLGKAMSGDETIVVNSAGCGSFLKEHVRVARRVRDASEFLLEQGIARALADSHGLQAKVTYHDACHLAHGQNIRSQPRELLKAVPGVQLVELEEADRCCGSGGIYNVTEPKLARQMLERKWSFIEKTRAEIVVMGNPGCHAWIAQAAREKGSNVRIMHTLELLESAFLG